MITSFCSFSFVCLEFSKDAKVSIFSWGMEGKKVLAVGHLKAKEEPQYFMHSSTVCQLLSN